MCDWETQACTWVWQPIVPLYMCVCYSRVDVRACIIWHQEPLPDEQSQPAPNSLVWFGMRDRDLTT